MFALQGLLQELPHRWTDCWTSGQLTSHVTILIPAPVCPVLVTK